MSTRPDVPTFAEIAQLFEPSLFETIGLVNHDPIWWTRAPLWVGVPDDRATSQTKDGPPEATDVALDDARGVDYPWRAQDRVPRPAVRWGYSIMAMRRRHKHRFEFVPSARTDAQRPSFRRQARHNTGRCSEPADRRRRTPQSDGIPWSR